MATRKIIEIDRDKCDGCGLCTTACAEGALELDAENKAVLVREFYCDGMGACLDVCPTGALRVVEREGEAYDPGAAFKHVLKTRGEEAAAKVHGHGPEGASDSGPGLRERPGPESSSESGPELRKRSGPEGVSDSGPRLRERLGPAGASESGPELRKRSGPAHERRFPSGCPGSVAVSPRPRRQRQSASTEVCESVSAPQAPANRDRGCESVSARRRQRVGTGVANAFRLVQYPSGRRRRRQPDVDARSGDLSVSASRLSQWPIQLHLVSPLAPYFQGADLLVAADCTAFALGSFHQDLLAGKKLVIACPKLDETDGYAAKLAEIIRLNGLKSLTVAIMSVPCCGGLYQLVRRAVEASGVDLPVRKVVIHIDGRVL